MLSYISSRELGPDTLVVSKEGDSDVTGFRVDRVATRNHRVSS